MKTILQDYVGREVGINYRKPYHIDSATLTAVKDRWLEVTCPDDGAIHTIPYTNILRIIRRAEGVEVGGLFTHRKSYPIVIKVGHLVDVAPMI